MKEGHAMALTRWQTGLERLGDEVRAITDRLPAITERLPIERARSRRSGAGSGTVVGAALAGAAIGALLAYVFDAEQGRRRRAIIRDKARAFARQTGEAMDGRSRDVMNRARGLVIEMRSRLPGAGEREQAGQRAAERPASGQGH
jgi:hypothetical protein